MTLQQDYDIEEENWKKKKNDEDLETVKMYQYKDWIVTTIYKL